MIVEWSEDSVMVIILIEGAAEGPATEAGLGDPEGCTRWAILRVTEGVVLL